MFKFLKTDDDDGKAKQIDSYQEKNNDAEPTIVNKSEKCKSHDFNVWPHYEIQSSIVPEEYLTQDGKTIKFIAVQRLFNSRFIQNNDAVQKIMASTSDLISGIYEGGFKTWECTFDLIAHFIDRIKYPVDSNHRVLDLGCGAGFLGIYSLSYDAVVHFHDYNPEVIDLLTIPNVILNGFDKKELEFGYFSGSWNSFLTYINNLTSDELPVDQGGSFCPEAKVLRLKPIFQYDYILSSETVYNLDSLPSFYAIIKKCLKPTGIMLLAAKTCYFGVGGGTKAFLQLLEEDGTMETQVMQVFRTGVQREIISVKWKN